MSTTNVSRFREEQLTAYVMGELELVERQYVEAQIAHDPEIRAEVEALRAFCGRVSAELSAEAMPKFSTADLEKLKRETEGRDGEASHRKVHWWAAVLPTLAAAAVAGVILYPRIKASMPKGLTPVTDVVDSRNAAEEVRFVPAPKVVAEPEAKSVATKDEALKQQAAEKRANAQTLANNKSPTLVSPSKPSSLASGAAGYAKGKADFKLAGPSGVSARRDLSRMAPGQPVDKGLLDDGMELDYNDMQVEAYDHILDNPFKSPHVDSLSTFSSDVDTAAYANVRRFVQMGQLPPKDAVRIEEMLNYFRYDYAEPSDDRPFHVDVEVGAAPWRPEHRLVRIGLKAKNLDFSKAKPSNLVFLIDTSGSMEPANRLPLVKQSMKLLVDNLTEKDHIAIVVYAGGSGLVLPSTSGGDKQKILDALENLHAGGSTNGGAGIELAYKTAEQHFIKGGVNRVVLATDGDFNVGVTSQGDLTRLIEQKAKSGVFLSVLGYGMGNYKDANLEKLADKGNGNYAYIDSINEARKVLVEEIGGTMVTVAKDVKLQVEFNPAEVVAYRLIGYENRIMAHQDFNNDLKDAGDIGAGHTVTALYEVVPKGVKFNVDGVDPLKYTKVEGQSSASDELLTLKLRYKAPDAAKSSLIEYAIKDKGLSGDDASEDLRFASAVAAFGMLLRDSEHKGSATHDLVLKLANEGKGKDQSGYRQEFIELVRKAKGLTR